MAGCRIELGVALVALPAGQAAEVGLCSDSAMLVVAISSKRKLASGGDSAGGFFVKRLVHVCGVHGLLKISTLSTE